MVDAAIERIAREHGLSHVDTSALSVVTPMDEQIRDRPTRLRWKGLDVSDEFRAYAERVARGEDLPPFEGRVLAEPNASFPWGKGLPRTPAVREGRTGRAALWSSAVAVLGLLGWSVAMKLEAAKVNDELGPAAVQAELALQAAPLVNDVVSDAVVGDAVIGEVVVDELATSSAASPNGSEAPAPTGVGAAASAAPGLASDVSPLHAALAPAAVEAAITPAAISPAPAAITPAAPVASAKPAPAAPTAVAPARPAAPVVAAPLAARPNDAAAPSKQLVDEFGIMEDGPSAPAQAKSALGSVGDLARAGQAPGGNVRKEPGGESSAKGVLLVETPSF